MPTVMGKQLAVDGEGQGVNWAVGFLKQQKYKSLTTWVLILVGLAFAYVRAKRAVEKGLFEV